MLRSDQKPKLDLDKHLNNNETINNEVILEIEKELQNNPYDLISLVFLLYEIPDTALQRLIIFQRISKEVSCSSNPTLLHAWFQHTNKNPEWKNKLVEALLICQLNSIVKKLGFQVARVKEDYKLDNMFAQTYINPAKKLLYKLCENIDSSNLLKLQKTLLIDGINTMGYDSAELVLLELMCQKFITLNEFISEKKVLKYEIKLDKLTKIIVSLPGLKKIASDLEILQQMFDDESKLNLLTSFQTAPILKVEEPEQQYTEDKYFPSDFKDTMDLLNELHLDNISEYLKSDTAIQNSIKSGIDCYDIRNPKRVGVCIIINQEDFYPSKDSIEHGVLCNGLRKRNGSDRDKAEIEESMYSLNYVIFSKTNIDHNEMIKFIKDIVYYKFCKDDSIFVLYVLSHGVQGYAYASNSVKVKIEEIQNLLDDSENLKGKPKLIIVQACQVDEKPVLVADGPANDNILIEKKTNFLVYCATAPELESTEQYGSIFIQTLCKIIKERAKKDHILDLYTTVNNIVKQICDQLNSFQLPIFQSTLTKNSIYNVPNNNEASLHQALIAP